MPEALSARALCSLEDVKHRVRESGTAFDDDLTRLVNAASAAILRESGREFVAAGSNPQTRTIDVGAAYRAPFEVWIGDLQSAPDSVVILDATGTTVLTIEAAETYTVAADLVLLPVNRPESWRPITGIRFRPSVRLLQPGYQIEVEGTWGFPEVPDDVREAAISQAAAWFTDRHAGDDYSGDHPSNALPRRLTPTAFDTIVSYRDHLV